MALYVNDGVYGSLADAGALGFRYPGAADPAGRAGAGGGAASASRLFGPTCDSADVMRGPFLLPADVAEGDWIEIGQLGAYGGCLRTASTASTGRGWSRCATRHCPACPALRNVPPPDRHLVSQEVRPLQHVAC